MGSKKKCGSTVQRSNEGYGLALVRSTSFGRKRVALFNDMDEFDYNDATPLKRQCSVDSFPSAEKPALEALPQDVLIRIVCGVEHDDLKRLFHVSKAIRDATLIAKKLHFEYSTPKKTLGFRNATDVEDLTEFNEVEAPNAPKQSRVPRSRLSQKKLADISVNLFASDDVDVWPRRDLSIDMEAEI